MTTTKKKTTKKKAAKKVSKTEKSKSTDEIVAVIPEIAIPSGKEEDFSINRPMSASSAAMILNTDIEKWKFDKEHPKPDSKATAYGSALHCLLLEPENFNKKFEVDKTAPRNKSKAIYGRTSQIFQNWLAEAQLRAGTKRVITDDEYKEVLVLQKAYKSLIDELVKIPGRTLVCERPVQWEDEETGHPCTGFIDAMIGGVILDLKTTSDMTDYMLHKKCENSYFIQAAVYAEAVRKLDGIENPLVMLIFMRSEPPYTIRKIIVDKNTLELGLREFRKAIRIYRECAEKQRFKISSEPTTWGYKYWKAKEIKGE